MRIESVDTPHQRQLGVLLHGALSETRTSLGKRPKVRVTGDSGIHLFLDLQNMSECSNQGAIIAEVTPNVLQFPDRKNCQTFTSQQVIMGCQATGCQVFGTEY